ncbi:hypothetical protein PIB30_009062 [Stylosanthes scabra]|uniref:Initiator tRNA phosphoribosyl transferase n=1 Tax=Stylosanthes scabra TaxID=79078 RepID=A0ABU6V5B8_9FABA|nr:hypothetical protein [Stylosanthes scabra]
MIVDSTRRGKRFPDSMSRTIPIWTCVLNRAIRDFKNDWDCSLHLPLWIPETEKASIEKRLDEWTQQLKASGADIASIAAGLRKPLRPLWISQKTVIWLNEVPHHDSWDFTPIILISASASASASASSGVSVSQQRTTSEFSWNYIAGAGDDEESWARGLTPALFWNNVYDIINAGPHVCNHMVADIVEKSRVNRAYRGENAPQITLKPTTSPSLSHQQPLYLSPTTTTADKLRITWLGSTNMALASSQIDAADAIDVDCILNCDRESISISLPSTEAYLHLPILGSKFDRFSLLNNLPSAVSFAKLNLSQGKRLVVCCDNGKAYPPLYSIDFMAGFNSK